MLHFHSFISLWMFSTVLLYGGVLVTSAQSFIFNVPSTDTQPVNTIYIEADLFAHFASYPNGGFQKFGPLTVYGLRKNVEIGVNFYYDREENKRALELQPNIKWKAYNGDKKGVAVSVGTIAFIPLNKAAGTRPTAMVYANGSKTIQSAKGMRLTGGIYQWINTEQNFGTKTGVMLGLEQPITKKMTLLVDWFSGKNRLGYSSVGFGYHESKSQYFGIVYSFGNSGRGNNYFTAFYGFTF